MTRHQVFSASWISLQTKPRTVDRDTRLRVRVVGVATSRTSTQSHSWSANATNAPSASRKRQQPFRLLLQRFRCLRPAHHEDRATGMRHARLYLYAGVAPLTPIYSTAKGWVRPATSRTIGKSLWHPAVHRSRKSLKKAAFRKHRSLNPYVKMYW